MFQQNQQKLNELKGLTRSPSHNEVDMREDLLQQIRNKVDFELRMKILKIQYFLLIILLAGFPI